MGVAPNVGQLMALFLKLLNAKKTIEVGVFTGYSLLLTAFTIPSDGKIIAMDLDREAYEIGLPFIKKVGVEHKIDFIESLALLVLDKLLEDTSFKRLNQSLKGPPQINKYSLILRVSPANERTFDFAFIDADKNNYWNYHERLIKLVKIGGIVAYDNTLLGGTVALPEKAVSEPKREWRRLSLAFNKAILKDCRIEITFVSIGDRVIICKCIR
ncbi:caffeoyl-CoA O-methyltransferase [Spatholobus suberectus]|nr:caffeoyl-CoA O-methyltransferase [Spatholobus suberectus]